MDNDKFICDEDDMEVIVDPDEENDEDQGEHVSLKIVDIECVTGIA